MGLVLLQDSLMYLSLITCGKFKPVVFELCHQYIFRLGEGGAAGEARGEAEEAG